MSLLKLQKERDDALKAVASAESDKARTKALGDLDKASLALAAFQTRIEAAKKVKTVKKEERYEEEEDDEPKKPAEEEEEEDGSSSDSSDSSDSSSDDSYSEEEEEKAEEEEEEAEEESEEEEEEKAKALLGSKSSAYSFMNLFALGQRITGKKGVREVFGALDAIDVRLKAAAELEKRVDKLEARQRKERVDALLSSARRDGKITQDAIASLKIKGLSDPRWLKAHLEALPKRVRTLDEGPATGQAFDGGKDGEERRSAHLSAQDLSSEQRKMIEAMCNGTGKTFDEFLAEMNKRNGAGRRSK